MVPSELDPAPIGETFWPVDPAPRQGERGRLALLFIWKQPCLISLTIAWPSGIL